MKCRVLNGCNYVDPADPSREIRLEPGETADVPDHVAAVLIDDGSLELDGQADEAEAAEAPTAKRAKRKTPDPQPAGEQE